MWGKRGTLGAGLVTTPAPKRQCTVTDAREHLTGSAEMVVRPLPLL